MQLVLIKLKQNLLPTDPDTDYWDTVSPMETKAGIHLVSKAGIRSPGVSCSVSWHDLPKDDWHRYCYWHEAGQKAKEEIGGEVSPDEQSQ